MLLAFMAGNDEWGGDGDEGAGAGWANSQAGSTARRFVRTSKNRLDALNLGAEPLPSGELRNELSGIFGPERTTTIARTEVTRGLSAGTVAAAKSHPDYARGGIGVYWRLGPTEVHCPVCLKWADRESESWENEIGPPPIHVRCACYLEIVRF
jgi:hypothetical protein